MSGPKKPRGFAALTLEKRREIAAKGGRSVPAEARGFFKDRAAARTAGQKGGKSRGPHGKA